MAPARGRSHCATGFVERGVQRSWVLMLVNFAFNVLPMPLTTAMMATEMPAAMRPYSMAVAPDSSFTNRETRVFMGSSLGPRGCLKHRPAGVITRRIRTFADHRGA